jgi:MFS family permease
LAEKLFKDLTVVGLLLAIPYLISALLDIPVGGLSDHLGRKRFFVGGLIIMALLGMLLPSIGTLTEFVVFMILFGFANILIVVPVRAYVMDIAPKGKTSEYFGVFEALTCVGFAVGPVIAGLLIANRLDIMVNSVGIFYFAMCLIAFTILLTLKETVKEERLTVSIKKLVTKDRLVVREFLEFEELGVAGVAILVSTFIIVFIDGLVWTLEPLYTTLGMSTSMVGLILSMFVLPFILFEFPAGWIADRFGKVRVFIAGLVAAGTFLILFGSVRDPKMLVVYAFFATTGLAFARPALDGFLTDISAKKERGGIVGVWNVAEDAAYVASPVIGGFIAEAYGIGATFMLIGGLLVLATPLIYSAIKKSGF